MVDKKLPTQEEEVDLGNLFKVIGKGISNLFNAIILFFTTLFHYFILFLIFLKRHAIKLGLAILIGVILGFIIDYKNQKSYVSNLIVETNFDSGVQLYKQINYLNDLVNKKDTLTLANTLNISIKEAAKFTDFNISPYQTSRNLYKAYDTYMQTTDTIYTKDFLVDDFKKRLGEYDYRFHNIEVQAFSNNVFKQTTPAIIALVENDYYKNLKNIKLNELNQKLTIYKKNLDQIDSLRYTYKEVAMKEADKSTSSSTIEIAKSDSEKNVNDIKLFETSNNILYQITSTNNEIIRNNNIINVISDFDKIGVVDKKLTHKKYFQFAVLFGGLMLLFILLKLLNKYLSEYK